MLLKQSEGVLPGTIWCDLLLRLLLYLSFRIQVKRPSPRRRFPSSAGPFRGNQVAEIGYFCYYLSCIPDPESLSLYDLRS